MYSVAADTLMVAARSAFPTREHAIAYIYIRQEIYFDDTKDELIWLTS